MDPRFLCAAVNSPPVRRQAAGLIAGVGRPRLNLKKLKGLKVPVPPLEDQVEAIRRLDANRAAEEATRDALSFGGVHVEALRRSILQQAFSGRLVPQDPADEPSSALIEQTQEVERVS